MCISEVSKIFCGNGGDTKITKKKNNTVIMLTCKGAIDSLHGRKHKVTEHKLSNLPRLLCYKLMNRFSQEAIKSWIIFSLI